MDDGVLAAEELQLERPGLYDVARRDDLHLELVARGRRDPLRRDDLRAGVLVQEPAEVFGSPVVGVLVRDHDRDHAGGLDRREERPRVDDDALVSDGQQQAGVFVLGDSHEKNPRGRPAF